jgi:hypothetical protein
MATVLSSPARLVGWVGLGRDGCAHRRRHARSTHLRAALSSPAGLRALVPILQFFPDVLLER